jgi:hypothetical protein
MKKTSRKLQAALNRRAIGLSRAVRTDRKRRSQTPKPKGNRGGSGS